MNDAPRKRTPIPDRYIEQALDLTFRAAGYDAKGDFLEANKLLKRARNLQAKYRKLKYGSTS
jgi:hypothetical protein